MDRLWHIVAVHDRQLSTLAFYTQQLIVQRCIARKGLSNFRRANPVLHRIIQESCGRKFSTLSMHLAEKLSAQISALHGVTAQQLT